MNPLQTLLTLLFYSPAHAHLSALLCIPLSSALWSYGRPYRIVASLRPCQSQPHRHPIATPRITTNHPA